MLMYVDVTFYEYGNEMKCVFNNKLNTFYLVKWHCTHGKGLLNERK